MTQLRLALPIPMGCNERPKIDVRDAHSAAEPVDWKSSGFDPAPSCPGGHAKMLRHLSDGEELHRLLPTTASRTVSGRSGAVRIVNWGVHLSPPLRHTQIAETDGNGPIFTGARNLRVPPVSPFMAMGRSVRHLSDFKSERSFPAPSRRSGGNILFRRASRG
jgi:hypothetical protein